MLRFITIYRVDNFIPYKQTPEFLRYLAHRDGLLSATSEAHYYIIHHQKELINKPNEIIEPNLVRHFIYTPSYLFKTAQFIAWFGIAREWKKYPAPEQILVINNTFHQLWLHILARGAGWRSLKIFGTFFHHTRQVFKKHIVNAMEWIHAFLASRIAVISPSGWEYVARRFHYKTRYAIPNFLYDAPSQTVLKTSSAEAKPFSAICLSRLEPEKGLFNLIEAWKNTGPRWHLTIYGDGSQKQSLTDYIYKNQLSDRVSVQNPVAHSEVFSTLSRHSIFILTSPCEGLGICYLEALFMKVPCIGLNVPGVKDTLADGRGLLLDPTNWKVSLNDALRQAMSLSNSLEWHREVEEFFSTSVIPRLNSETSKWFEE
jgi:glycosyltransferase involved in cell wall biosynthesis